MAVKTRSRSSVGSFLRFVVRFVGLNGLVAAAIGAVLWFALGNEEVGRIVVIAGGSAAALALLVELPGFLLAVASHRGAAGINVFVQLALASALVIGGNVYSFWNHLRFDCTRDQVFTLDPQLQDKLAQLRGETDIVIYLQHVSFGQRVDLRQDEYDQAAEKVIVEKIRDLVEQFQELGEHFHLNVHVLDTQKKTIKAGRQKIAAISEDLLQAIEKAPEDSIFFYARDTQKIQRLSFNDIYHLDRKASLEANGKLGNLVLIDQGVNSFSEKVFKIEEKKPRVGFAVVHGWLGQDGTEVFGMPGFKNVLASRGYEGRDIVLGIRPEALALEHEENRYEVLTAKKNRYEREIAAMQEELADTVKEREYWQKKNVADINKERVLVPTNLGWRVITRAQLESIRKAQGRIPTTRTIPEEFRVEMVSDLAEDKELLEKELASHRKKLDKALEDQGKLHVENLEEQRRISDVRVKFNRLLADVDLLVVPRFTVKSLIERNMVPPQVHELDTAHLEAIKDFMKAGKPVFFLLGPHPNQRFTRAGPTEDPDPEAGQDSLEKLLASFNIVLPSQTIVYTVEAEAMEERDERQQMGGAAVDVPPATFDWGRSARGLPSLSGKALSPIRASMRLTTRGFGGKTGEGVKSRNQRPIYVERFTWEPQTIASAFGAFLLPVPLSGPQAWNLLASKKIANFDESAVFLMTDPDCWNEDRPFPTERWTPHFQRPKSDDPEKNTLQEKRRGPFPIGIALETEVPASWYEKDTTKKPGKVRLAVIGDGSLFVGDTMPPLTEKLFLDVSNWLMGRENLLAHESATWQYPRVQLDPEMKNLWEWGTRFALPLFFVFLGANVWLVRRMR